MDQKGYLGPIGDDIPSLIPILVGLVTFFAAFTFTLNEYTTRSNSFNADRDTLVIANALKGDSYIATPGEFISSCTALRIRGLNYAAGVVESSEWADIASKASGSGGGPSIPVLAEAADHFYLMESISLQCATGLSTPIDKGELADIIQNRPFVVLAFPVAIQSDYAVVPSTLVVITWKP